MARRETHGVKSNGNRASGLDSLGLTGVVDDRLVVLKTSEFCSAAFLSPCADLGLTSYEP
jgi:hypothetical protein